MSGDDNRGNREINNRPVRAVVKNKTLKIRDDDGTLRDPANRDERRAAEKMVDLAERRAEKDLDRKIPAIIRDLPALMETTHHEIEALAHRLWEIRQLAENDEVRGEALIHQLGMLYAWVNVMCELAESTAPPQIRASGAIPRMVDASARRHTPMWRATAHPIDSSKPS